MKKKFFFIMIIIYIKYNIISNKFLSFALFLQVISIVFLVACRKETEEEEEKN
jgi:hypothetical protein